MVYTRVFFYCLTAAFGCCFALAQQGSNNKILRDAPQASQGDSNAASGTTAGPTGLPTWTGGFTYKGITYSYTMVGTDPKTCSTTTIPVYIVPLKLIYSDGTVFDPNATMPKDTISALTAVTSSPIFSPATDIATGGVDLGPSQLIDAFQRANFWSEVSSKSCNYHVQLAPMTLPTQTFNVPKSAGKTEPGPVAPYLRGTLAQNFIDKNITGPVFAANPQIGPGSFTIFLTYNVFPGNAYGYHAVYGNSVTTGLTYAYVSYLQPYTQLIDADISTLAHEVAEWMDDPYTNNHTPCGILEVGDPLNSAIWDLTDNSGRIWHPQDLAMVGYFYQTPVPSVNGWLTFKNTYSTACANGS